MFLRQVRTIVIMAGAGIFCMAGILKVWAVDGAPTNNSTELQPPSRFDIGKITGSLPPQTNSDTGAPVSLLSPAATIKFPVSNEVVQGKNVEIKVGTEYPTSQAQVYHVIVNNDAPLVYAEGGKPLVLSNLNIGGNLLRVFIVSEDGKIGPMTRSFAMTYFYFHKKDFSNIVRTGQPFLSVNLPLDGPAIADEKGRICFDYYVHNAVIGEKNGVKIKYSLNQRDETLDKPGPVYWNDLAPGKYTLTAELVDAQGAPILGTYCKVERSFEVSRIMKPLQLEKEDSVLRELMNRPQTNAPTATNPPANYTTTNTPAPAPTPDPSNTKKNKTLKPRQQ